MESNVVEQEKIRTRTRRVQFYTLLVAILGLLVILISAYRPPSDWRGLVIFLAMASISELMSVELFLSSRESSISVSVIIAIASILVLGFSAGVFIQAISALITSIKLILFQRQKQAKKNTSWLRIMSFNIGMFAISTFAAGNLYFALGGDIDNVARITNLIPLVAAVTAYVIVNLSLLIGVIALQTGRNPANIWSQDFRWGVPINIFGGIFGGALLALAYNYYGEIGLIVFFLPVLSIGYSFRLYVDHTKKYVNKLEDLNNTLDKVNIGLLETLGAVIDAFDLYTYGHSAQVAIYAKALSEKMGLTHEEQSLVFKAALVHDIGKISVTEKIISKQGSLTDEEITTVRRHPIIGADILRRMDGLHDLIPIVRHHHERWDGGGYPAGLARTEIPLGARILALADSVDAMYSDRPYRKTMSLEQIKAEVQNCSGTQFDPGVVDAFFEMIKEKGQGFLRNSATTVDQSVHLDRIDSISPRLNFLKRSMVSDPAQPGSP